MSLNHIVKNGLKDVSLDVKDLNCTSITVNNLPIESFDQDLNTTDNVRFNKISVTSTMFTDPDQVVSKQYVDNSAPGLGSLQSAYDGGNTILTASGFPVELTGTEGLNLNSNPITTGKLTFPNSQELVSRQYVDDAIAATSLQDAYDGGNTIITTSPASPVDIQGNLNSTVINTPELTIQNCTITNPSNDLIIDSDGGNGFITLNASIVRNVGQLACVGLSGTGIIMNNQEIVTNKTVFTNDQELVSKKYVSDSILASGKTVVLFDQSVDYLVVNGGFYTDGNITLGWDAATQTEFLINTLPATGGITVSSLNGGTASSIFATQANLKYDIGGSLLSGVVLQSWIHSNTDAAYTNYYITILRVGGGENSILTVERY